MISMVPSPKVQNACSWSQSLNYLKGQDVSVHLIQMHVAYVYEQQRLWWDCADAQARLSLGCLSTSKLPVHFLLFSVVPELLVCCRGCWNQCFYGDSEFMSIRMWPYVSIYSIVFLCDIYDLSTFNTQWCCHVKVNIYHSYILHQGYI